MTTGWSRIGLRARLMTIGVTGLAAALAIGGVTLYVALGYFADRTLVADERATARAVATLVEQGRLPDQVPVSGAHLVQVVDANHRVVTASASSDRLTSLLTPQELTQGAGGAALDVPGSRAGLDSTLRVVTQPVDSPSGPMTVVVAAENEAIGHSRAILGTTLLVTGPVLLAVLALIAWWVIGRTLLTVETLRAAADRVSDAARRDDDRLPVPAANDEVRALALTLNAMLDRLAAARARQRSFVSDAAHELRNPLASMRAQLEVAQRLGEGGELTEDLSPEVERLSALVEDLLMLARADADRPPPASTEPFLVEPLLDKVALGRSRGRVLVVPDVGGPTEAIGNATEIQRLLDNLVDNAVRHATSRVALTVDDDGDHVVVGVVDDGPGIPQRDRERVFERFTRLDDARDRDAGGSGLGLAIARELARRSGGTLSLGDAAGGGLRVELRLSASTSRPGQPDVSPSPGGHQARHV